MMNGEDGGEAAAQDWGSAVGLPTDSPAGRLLIEGGPVVWIIAALSVAALALILWKLWRFAALGTGRRAGAERAVAAWTEGREAEALETARAAPGGIARVSAAAMAALLRHGDEDKAREETTRIARSYLAELRAGLRGLEIIVVIAPLLGLLGTVLGMIEAFQALQDSGARADPAALAGGIWEALLTTAAGMGVAIPASVALSYFESVVERVRLGMEDAAARIFAERRPAAKALRAAE